MIKLSRPALVVTLLACVTACGASSAPEPSASAAPSAVETSPSAAAEPVTASMPDVLGGNAGRAAEQMGPELDMVFEDASGQGRPVDDPAEWKICDSRPEPYRQITEYPVVFGVVRVSESCE